MKILVTGSGGLIGSALLDALKSDETTRLVRSRTKEGFPPSIFWDPKTGEIEQEKLEGFDGVVHLAGEGIAQGRWTLSKKARIRESRLRGTRFLCETLVHLSRPPKVLVCASAIGYYGNRGEESLRETSRPGAGFLAQLCQEWESAAQSASQKGIRVVNLRIGIVLSPRGGALSLMLPVFKLGLGGALGNGRQMMSWIAIDDLAGAIRHALTTDSLRGPVNAVSPNPVTNAQFTKAMGRVLRRPVFFPVPSFAVKLLFGEMGEELLLSSTRVEPINLLASGFTFRYPELDGALRFLLGRA